MKKKVFLTILLVLFFVSRFYVLSNPPYKGCDPNDPKKCWGYSDVKHDYERYVNMWRYGTGPYFKHLFEYPPAAIPIMYLPLEVDQSGLGYYYLNYRVQIMIFETVLFVLMLMVVARYATSWRARWLAMLFYISVGVVAKNYWYEGLDLIFIGTYTLGLLALLKKRKQLKKYFFWLLFWVSTSIKFMTGPLLVPLYLLWEKKLIKNWWQKAMPVIITFGLVWGVPALIFRSSLTVPFVFHWGRRLKYGSLGTFIVNVINDFTGTEKLLAHPPDFAMAGPVSDIVLKLFGILFWLAIVSVLVYAAILIKKYKGKRDNWWRFVTALKISLVYVLTMFLTGKTFSSPFHIWYVPLITLFPFRSLKKQMLFVVLAMYILILDTTSWVNVTDEAVWGPIKGIRFRDLTRFLPMMIILSESIKLEAVKKRLS